MEAPEVPLEQSQEHIQQHAEHAGSEPMSRWIMGVALSSAILAALAAVASLLAGHHANEAMISQLKANDQTVKASNQWAYYQAKGVKANVLASKIELLSNLGKEAGPDDAQRVARYETEQKEIKAKAEEFEHEAKHLEEEGEAHLDSHVVLARSVTMFQVSIAVAAVSVLTRKRMFWFVSMMFGALGIVFMLQQLLGLGQHGGH
ncbi:MAG: DUF4337 domain-containing protein [Verrucomicrobia bacterium]|nr:DUF4337 domain-containing protein [Verrucomicrobiota bacterium]MBV9656852.1 DUF4337 domain-containing protein [Verrucomicrobiota bacterium]